MYKYVRPQYYLDFEEEEDTVGPVRRRYTNNNPGQPRTRTPYVNDAVLLLYIFLIANFQNKDFAK